MDGYEVLAGTVIAAHGVQGAVKVRLATKTSLALIEPADGGERRPVDVWISLRPNRNGKSGDAGQLVSITQVKALIAGGSVFLVKLKGVRDRDAALALIGHDIFAPQDRRAPLQEHEYFTKDLIGIEVVGDSGGDYGKIKSVLPQPANDVYETDRGALIPAVKEFVLSVDLDARRMLVRDVPGLRPEEAEEIPSSDGRAHRESPKSELAATLDAG